jgi:hypothetical protein
MSRAPCTFKQRDITAAVKAVTAAGVDVARVEVDKSGRIVIVAGKRGESMSNEGSSWDKAIADLEAR